MVCIKCPYVFDFELIFFKGARVLIHTKIMSFFQGRFENTKRAFWNQLTFSLSSNLSLFHARAFPDCKITLFTFMSRFLFCVGVHSQTTWTRFCPLLTTYLGTLVQLWGKTSVYRWHFQTHLPMYLVLSTWLKNEP